MKNERKFIFFYSLHNIQMEIHYFFVLCLLLFAFQSFGQVVSCDSNEIIVSIDEEITPITCTVSIASQPISIYPDLPNGLTFSNNVISGKPISSYPMTTHYVSSRLTSFPIKIAVYGEPTSLTYGFDYVTLYKGVSFEPFVPVSDAPLTGFTIQPSLPDGMLFNATSGVISGTPSLYAILADETRFFIEGTYNQYTISTSFIMQLKNHDELPVSSGLSGCYLSFSTSCFVEEESFYSTRPFDICKSESSIDFSDDFVAGSGGHSWVGLPESYSPLIFLYSVLASLIISQQHSMAILMPLLLEIILFI